MDEQGASSGNQMEEKGLWSMERGAGHLGGVQEYCQSMRDATRKTKVHL